MKKLLTKLTQQKGQGLTEYAVILSLIAVASIAGMVAFSGTVKGRVHQIVEAIAGDGFDENLENQIKSKKDKLKNDSIENKKSMKVKKNEVILD